MKIYFLSTFTIFFMVFGTPLCAQDKIKCADDVERFLSPPSHLETLIPTTEAIPVEEVVSPYKGYLPEAVIESATRVLHSMKQERASNSNGGFFPFGTVGIQEYQLAAGLQTASDAWSHIKLLEMEGVLQQENDIISRRGTYRPVFSAEEKLLKIPSRSSKLPDGNYADDFILVFEEFREGFTIEDVIIFLRIDDRTLQSWIKNLENKYMIKVVDGRDGLKTRYQWAEHLLLLSLEALSRRGIGRYIEGPAIPSTLATSSFELDRRQFPEEFDLNGFLNNPDNWEVRAHWDTSPIWVSIPPISRERLNAAGKLSPNAGYVPQEMLDDAKRVLDSSSENLSKRTFTIREYGFALNIESNDFNLYSHVDILEAEGIFKKMGDHSYEYTSNAREKLSGLKVRTVERGEFLFNLHALWESEILPKDSSSTISARELAVFWRVRHATAYNWIQQGIKYNLLEKEELSVARPLPQFRRKVVYRWKEGVQEVLFRMLQESTD